MKFLSRFEEHIYAALRIVSGLMFACHGAGKLFGFLGGPKMSEPLMVLAGGIEFFGGLLIALGFFGAVAAFIASGEMAVGYFVGHAPHGFWPTVNKGELAVLYCFLFLYIAAHGSGAFSVDRLIRKKP